MFLDGQKLHPYIPMAEARGFTGAVDKEDFSNFCDYMCEPSWATKVTLTRNFRGKLSQRAENYGRKS